MEHDARPWWSSETYGYNNIKSYTVVSHEPRDISAESVSAFIRHKLVYDAHTLQRLVLGRRVTLSEGLYSADAYGLRTLVHSLEYAV